MPGDSSLHADVTARVCREIERRGLRSGEAAALLGVSSQTIRNWRNGSRIRSSHVETAASVFGVPFSDLAETDLERELRERAKRDQVVAAISEGLDDQAIEVLASYKPETIRLVLSVALARFAAGVDGKPGRLHVANRSST